MSVQDRGFAAASIILALGIGAPMALGENIYRINCGGPEYVDAAGNVWQSDNGSGFFNAGKTPPGPLPDTVDILETELDELYRSERYDTAEAPDMTYVMPVTPGYYLVKLHFAETYWSKPNRRKFDVLIEGETVLVNYDIVDGIGSLTADIRQFVAVVTDNDLQIVFQHASPPLDHPKISAIEVDRISTAPVITRVTPSGLSVAQGSGCASSGNRVSLTADDPDTDDTGLTWSVKRLPKLGTVSFVAGVMDGPAVSVCYTPAVGQRNDDSFVIQVTDGDASGGSAETAVHVTLYDAGAPIITCPGTLTVSAGDSTEPGDLEIPTVTDAVDFSPALTYTDSVETRSCPEVLRIHRTWTATDAAGNTATCTQLIKVRDADADGDGTVDCRDACPYDALKTQPGVCGCNFDDADRNRDGQSDCTPVQKDGGTGGELPAPSAQDCCGGGTPALTPLMMLAWSRRRRKRLQSRSSQL